MPVSSNRSLGIKSTNATNSSFIVITTLHVSYSLSAHHQEFLALHRLWCILCSCDDRLLLHPAPGGKRSSQLHKMYQSRCTAKNSRWWTERLPETCRVVIAIKLEFSASIGFIHKESVSLYYAVNNPTQTTTDHKPSHCTSAQSSERSRVRRSIRLFI